MCITVHGTVHTSLVPGRGLGTRLSAYEICNALTFEDSFQYRRFSTAGAALDRNLVLPRSQRRKMTVPFVLLIPVLVLPVAERRFLV